MSSVSPRRLLVMSYHFPPDPAVGGLRWYGITKHLARLGWEIDVVTSAVGADAVKVPGVTVHVRERGITANDRYKKLVAQRNAGSSGTSSSPGTTPSSVGAPQKGGLLVQTRKLIGASLAFPDQARGWVLRATKVAMGLLSKHKYDLVISSGPPHAVHLAGMFATLGRGIPLWVDFRDPWAIMVGKVAINSTVTKHRRSIQLLQHLVFMHAKRVIVNNHAFADALRIAEPGLSISAIPNAVDTDNFPPRTSERFPECSVSHIGTLYAGRSVTSVLEAMRALVATHPDARSRFRLHLAGVMDPLHRDRFVADLARSGVNEMVKVEGMLKRPAALNLLVRSQLALVLAQDQPLCVPAKLYESIGLGVPTLVIAEPGSASAVEARRLGVMTADPADSDAIRRVFIDALEGRIPATFQPAFPIAYSATAIEVDRLIRSELGGTLTGPVREATAADPTESRAT